MATKRKQESFTLITSDKTDKTKNGKKKREKQGKSLYKGKVVNTTN